MSNPAKIALLEVRRRWWANRGSHRHREWQHFAIQGKRAHDWQDYHRRHGESKAAAVNQKQIEVLRPLIAHWRHLAEHADAEVTRYNDALRRLRPKPTDGIPASGEGVCVPHTSWNPYRRKMSNWVAREVRDAVAHGAHGVVTSGLRTYAEQSYLYNLYRYHGGNIAAPPGSSNHEGYVYRRGAVDWSNPESLNAALRRKGSAKLLWAETHGLADWPHFSGTGH